MPAEWPYVQELDFQCRLAVAAADEMSAVADRMWPPQDNMPPAADWFDQAQRFFCSVGVIAKILYTRDRVNASTRD